MQQPDSKPANFREARCPVVNSRVILTSPSTPNDAQEYTYTGCSNINNCFYRKDFQGQIQECLLHALLRDGQ